MELYTQLISWAWSLSDLSTRFLGRSRSKRYRTPSHLERLPLEILLWITNSLGDVDGACLALCSTPLFYNLRFFVLNLQRKDHTGRSDFLARLYQDNSQYVLCYKHSSLHRLRRPLGPPCIYGGYVPRCAGAAARDLADSMTLSSTSRKYFLTFHHVHMVMKRYLHGTPGGIDLDALRWAEISTSKPQGLTLSLSVEPQVISGQLCLRVQQWTSFNSNHVHQMLRDPHLACHLTPLRCIHHWYIARENTGCDVSSNRCVEPFSQGAHVQRYRQCPVCLTESQIEVRCFGTNGTAIIMTKWLDLGTGHSPWDRKWRRHRDYEYHIGLVVPKSTADTPIRDRFEEQSSRTQARLTAETESLILDEQYRKTFKRYRSPYATFYDQMEHEVWIRYPYSPCDPRLPVLSR